MPTDLNNVAWVNGKMVVYIVAGTPYSVAYVDRKIAITTASEVATTYDLEVVVV